MQAINTSLQDNVLFSISFTLCQWFRLAIILHSSTTSTELCLTTLNCKGRLPLEALVVLLGCVSPHNGAVGLLCAPQVHLMVCWSFRAHYSENPCHCPCPSSTPHFSSLVMRCLYLHQVLITNAEAARGIPCLPLPVFMSDTCKRGIILCGSYHKHAGTTELDLEGWPRNDISILQTGKKAYVPKNRVYIKRQCAVRAAENSDDGTKHATLRKNICCMI